MSVHRAVADDGITELHWIEKVATRRNQAGGTGFGSTLVSASARQIGATVDQSSDEGAYRLTLSIPSAGPNRAEKSSS